MLRRSTSSPYTSGGARPRDADSQCLRRATLSFILSYSLSLSHRGCAIAGNICLCARCNLSYSPTLRSAGLQVAVPGGQQCKWNVHASPDGSLEDLSTGREYPYLFWEADSSDGRVSRSFGLDDTRSFCVAGDAAGTGLVICYRVNPCTYHRNRRSHRTYGSCRACRSYRTPVRPKNGFRTM